MSQDAMITAPAAVEAPPAPDGTSSTEPKAAAKPDEAPRKAAGARDPKAAMRQAMLQGPILRVLAKLAWPTVTVLVVQTLVGVVQTFYVSFLGTDALAGVALVFPILMLMTMMSNGGIGGGVSSAVARAFGAGRRNDADALVLHALVIALVFGLVFMVAAWLVGPALYRALGGDGPALDAALTYSGSVFLGSVPIWIVNLMASALRGAGNVKVPALVTFVSAAVLIVLSPVFIFGIGPVPGLGIAGAGVAVTLFNTVTATVLLLYTISGKGGLILKRVRLEARLFRDILGVGLLSALGTLQANLTTVLITGAVGTFGAGTIAGYGTASRLDYILIPPMFGLGTAIVVMVGTNVGAGQIARARRIAWIGALLAAAFTEAIGLVAAVAPTAWLGLFSRDPIVLETGSLYLRTVAPFYGLVGLGMLFYFASQGAGRVLGPFLAGTMRLLIAAGVGWIAVKELGFGLSMLFSIVAGAIVVFGAINVVAMQLWRPETRPIGQAGRQA
jgi:putative MATE family efflux protein